MVSEKNNFLRIILLLLLATSCKVTKKHPYTNSLQYEKSPYLLQHAHNPVAWQAWNDNTLHSAVTQQKLMVISIGYAACHWCHVMEKESFSDSTMAYLMNQNFVNIKVDREERPDIDQIYMSVCRMTNEKGCGWPLNVITLPNGQPVWVGSYLEKNQWQKTLTYFLNAQKTDNEKLKKYTQYLKENIEVLNAGRVQNPASVTTNVTNTLDKWTESGLYDQLEGGFARYAVDSAWRVPHFEKMLYDNAQMISLYSQAFQMTKKEQYRQVVQETIHFLEQNFKAKKGGFYASFDTDSEGDEGTFYTWKKSEIEQILGDDTDFFCNYFSITEKGNWENGKNILYLNKNIKNSLSDNYKINNLKNKVLTSRKKRISPTLDTKIITSWNALMASAYVAAYKALGDEKYLTEALQIGEFIARKHRGTNGKLSHTQYLNSEAFLDDYAFSAQAYLDLYQVTLDKKWLYSANKLADYATQRFPQNEQGLFHFSATKNALYTASAIEINDAEVPSANATLANVLYDLSVYFDNKKYAETVKKMQNTLQNTVLQQNTLQYHYAWGNLWLKTLYPRYEVAIVGKNAKKVLKTLQSYPFSNILWIGAETENNEFSLLEGKYQKGETMIYVCQNKVCQMPTKSVEEAVKLIKF